MVSTDTYCVGNHSKRTAAVDQHGGRPLCRKHLNRYQQDDRITAYIETGPRCPKHPRRPKVTRWHGEPRLFCPTPKGEPVHYRASGRGVFRRPAGTTYVDWCDWYTAIPREIITGRR